MNTNTNPEAATPAPAVPARTIRSVGAKKIISLSIDPEVLATLDAWAKHRGVSRAAAIAVACASLQ